jgi:hypothetical protein
MAFDHYVGEQLLVCAQRVHPPVEDTSRLEAAREALLQFNRCGRAAAKRVMPPELTRQTSNRLPSRAPRLYPCAVNSGEGRHA